MSLFFSECSLFYNICPCFMDAVSSLKSQKILIVGVKKIVLFYSPHCSCFLQFLSSVCFGIVFHFGGFFQMTSDL